MREHLGVAARVEVVAGRLELSAELRVVVDLAVLRGPHPSALIAERLMAVLDVDDAQPARPERHSRALGVAVVIRPTMADDVGHPLEDRLIQRRHGSSVDRKRAGDTAHAYLTRTLARPYF